MRRTINKTISLDREIIDMMSRQAEEMKISSSALVRILVLKHEKEAQHD